MAMKQRIDLETCIECGACVPECPVNAIAESPYVIDPETCTNCLACPAACPVEAISGYDYEPPEPPPPATGNSATSPGMGTNQSD
jgi:NAD-dependent dihydropyrimidine dehydrogenase PreA subunit